MRVLGAGCLAPGAFVLSAACLVLGAVCSGQSPPVASEASQAGLIAGQVVDRMTGQPLEGARVRWEGGPFEMTIDPSGAVQLQPREVVADSLGRFVITNRPAGVYTLMVSTTGFEEGLASIRLQPDERVTDVLVRLDPHATLSGTIRDETGDPIVGTPVRAYVKATVQAGMVLVPKGERAITDDRGEFRLTDLPRGNYLICVCEDHRRPLDPLLQQLMGRSPDSTSLPSRFVPTFHRGSHVTSGANAIRLLAGEHRGGIDIEVRTTTSVRVSGRLQNLSMDPTTGMAIMLVPGGDLSGLGATTILPASMTADGVFQFADVPSGRYSLEAFPKNPEKPGWASIPLTVESQNIDDLVVELGAGAAFAGRLDFGEAVPPMGSSSGRLVLLPVDPTPRLVLASDTAMLIARLSAVDKDGRFRIDHLPPGRYWVSYSGVPPWVPANAIVTVGEKDIEDAIVTMVKDAGGSIEAIVELERHESPQGIRVRVFSADASLWAEPFRNPRRFVTTVSGTSTFFVGDLPAGDYFVTTDMQNLDSPLETFELLSRTAARVTVRAGETVKVTIRK